MQSNSVTISRRLFPGDCLRLKYVWNCCSELPVRTCTFSSLTLADLFAGQICELSGWLNWVTALFIVYQFAYFMFIWGTYKKEENQPSLYSG